MEYNSIAKFLLYAANENGVSWMFKRSLYELKRKYKWHNYKFNKRDWNNNEFNKWVIPEVSNNPNDYFKIWKKNRPMFFFQPKKRLQYARSIKGLLNKSELKKIITKAEKIKNGEFQYFSSQNYKINFPPDWHLNPICEKRINSNLHWNEIPIFSENTGDLKYVWEIGRFSFTYDLVRAFWISGDSSYAESFWQILDDWYEKNPPNTGAHWKCGQEISIRLMALCFGLYAFVDTPSTTPERFVRLVGLIAAQADRVAKDHVYAHLQFNNHSISEGVGLWTIGILFPELNISEYLRKKGKKILELESQRLIFNDGSFSQNSSNYHRVMLMGYLYAIQLGKLNSYEFSNTLHKQIKNAHRFLFNLLEENSGKVPNYGGNDGALILPLNNCDYQDYRPIIASIHYLYEKTLLFDKGPWLEDLVWFFGPESLNAKKQYSKPKKMRAESSGYFTIRSKSSWCMVRCGSHNTRPSHADMLHVDIWRNELNIAGDPGSYLYYHKPWNYKFQSTALHNTVTVDSLDQMERGPRFMWYKWNKSKTRYNMQDSSGQLQYFEGEHYGYLRLSKSIVHRRGILLISEDTWIIIDDLLGEGIHDFTLHWLLPNNSFDKKLNSNTVLIENGDNPYSLLINCLSEHDNPTKFEIIEGSEISNCYGWQSLYYGTKEKRKSILLNLRSNPPTRFLSVFVNNPDNVIAINNKGFLKIKVESGYAVVSLNKPGKKSILSNSIIKHNSAENILQIN